MNYRSEIDGLRAVAVLPVILFHAGFTVFGGGYVGVDVFFVISGYLITSIILDERDEGRFSILNFYERRVRRILPALFLVMAATIPFAWIWFQPQAFLEYAESLVAVPAFVSNVLFWKQGGYFATANELKPLLHTWSLAVEEQYYILFPLFLALMWRLGKRWILIMLVLFCVISLAMAHWGAYNKPVATFFLLPMRAWEILMGSMVAFYFNRYDVAPGPVIVRQLGSALGFIMIIAAVFLYDDATPFPSLYALLPTLGTVFIILFTDRHTVMQKLLGNRLMVGIGLISYSAYLWHQPLFAFARYRSLGEPSELLMLGLSTAALVLAYLTWLLVERPFRNRKLMSRTMVFSISAAAAAGLIGFGVAGAMTKGFPDRVEMPPNLQWTSLGARLRAEGDVCSVKPVEGFEGVYACEFGDPNGSRTVALYGDSHGQAIGASMNRSLTAKGWRGLKVTLEACELVPYIGGTPDPDAQARAVDCARHMDNMVDYLSEAADDVVAISRWSMRLYPIEGVITSARFANGEGGAERDLPTVEYGVLRSDGEPLKEAEPKAEALTKFLTRLADAGKLILVYPIPETGWDIYRLNLYHWQDTGEVLQDVDLPKQIYLDRNGFVLDVFDKAVANIPGIVPIRSDEIFCDEIKPGRCVVQSGGVPLYYDDDHVSDVGADKIVERIMWAAGL